MHLEKNAFRFIECVRICLRRRNNGMRRKWFVFVLLFRFDESVFFLVFKRVVHLRRLLMLSFSCVAFFFRWELIAIGSSRVSIWSNVCGSIYFLGKRVVVRRRRFVFVFLCSFVWENINCDWKYSCVLRLSKVFGII